MVKAKPAGESILHSVSMLRMPRSMVVGNGSIAKIGQEVKRLNAKKVLVVTDRHIVRLGLLEQAIEALKAEELEFDLFEEVEAEPTIGVVERAIGIVKENRCDLIIGLGGGSVLDAAKVAACLAKNEGEVRIFFGANRIVKHGLPCVLVPTTGGTGSEVSHVAMITDEVNGEKKLISDDKLLAMLSIVDPTLTRTVPPRLTAYVGMDALTHALGAYITRKANPLTDALAIEAINLIGKGLRQAVHQGEKDLEARYRMSLGAMIGMIARINSGGGAVHGLSYPLSTKYHLSHAQAVALMTPWVMGYNIPFAVPKFARVAEALGEKTTNLSEKTAAESAVAAINALMKDIGILQGLREFGIKREDFPEFAEMVYESSYRHIEANPRMLSKDEIVQIYELAW